MIEKDKGDAKASNPTLLASKSTSISIKNLKVSSLFNILDHLATEHVMSLKLIQNVSVFKYYCSYLKAIKFYSIRGHHDKVNSLVHLNDINKNYILSASSDKTIRIFNLSTCQNVFTFRGHEEPIWCLLRLSLKIFASGSSDKTIKIWDIDDDSGFINSLEGHDATVTCLTDLKENFASGAKDSHIILWNKKTYQKIKAFSPGYCNFFCLKETEIGSKMYLLAAGSNKTIFLLNLEKTEVEHRFIGHREAVLVLLVFKKDYLLSGSDDKSIKLWETKSGDCLNTLRKHSKSVTCLSLYNDDVFLSGSSDSTLSMWVFKSFDEVLEVFSINIWKGCNLIEDIRLFQRELIAGSGEDNKIYIYRAFKFGE